MKAILISLESMIGEKASNGNPYAIYTARFIVPVTLSQAEVTTPNWQRLTQGYKAMEQQVTEQTYSSLEQLAKDNGGLMKPLPVTLDTVMEVGRSGSMEMQIIGAEKT